jgi:hypothetical protein
MVLTVLLSGAAKAGDVTSSVDVTFYGYIKVDTIYQDAKAVQLDYLVLAPPNNLYDGYKGPAGHEYVKNGDDPAFGITARQTRFGFKLKGPTFGNGGQILGKIEGDFYGSTYTAGTDSWENKGNFALRIAEIVLKQKNWDLLVGNEWMVVSPLAPHSSNYTYAAELGNLGYRMPQIRLTTYFLDNKLQVQMAANNKIGDYTGFGTFQDIDTGRNSAVPDGELMIGWDSKLNDKPFKLGISGHYGREVLGGEHNPSVSSYSANLHFMLPLTKWLSINGEYYQGANLDGYYTGGQGKGWYIDKDGHYKAMEDTGGWAELELGPLSNGKVLLYTGYTWDDPDDANLKSATATGINNIKLAPPVWPFAKWQEITRNQSYYASVHYWVVPKSTDISLEWMQVDTKYGLAHPGNYGATAHWDDGIADRYTLSFWLFF